MVKYTKHKQINNYDWLTTYYKKIILSYQKRKGHHALLLQSNKGNGKYVLMFSISNWLICKNTDKEKICNQCSDCKLMLAGYHPDFYILSPNKNEKNIGIETIRSLTDKLFKKSHKKGNKVALIQNSETLTNQAINALLKIVEEPPKYTYFLFGIENAIKIPASLKSRCAHWYLPTPQEEIGLKWLKKNTLNNNNASIATALKLCNGAPLAAQYLLQPNHWKLRLSLCATITQAILNNNYFLLLQSLNTNNDKNDDMILCWYISLLIDAIKLQKKEYNTLINIDQINLIENISLTWSTKMLHNQVQQWLKHRYYCININNINKELLLIYQIFNLNKNITNHYYSNILDI